MASNLIGRHFDRTERSVVSGEISLYKSEVFN